MIEQRLGYIIKRTQQILRLRMDKALESVGITTPQYAALNMLEENPGLSNAELARRCFLTPQTMHKMVIGMEEKGLIKRKPDPSHGRKIKTLLTSDGEEKLKQAYEIVSQIGLEMTKNLSRKETEQAIKSLKKCIESLEAP